MKFDLRPYSEEYAYAYVNVDHSERAGFLQWLAANNCDVDDENVSGWDCLVNIHGKGGAILFKMTWGGQESKEELERTAALHDFIKGISAGAA